MAEPPYIESIPGRVAQTLAARENAAGYPRLRLMLTGVLPRLVGDAPATKSG